MSPPPLPTSMPKTVSILFHIVEVIIMIGKNKKEVDLTQDGSPQLQGMDLHYPPPLPWFRDESLCTFPVKFGPTLKKLFLPPYV